MRQDDDNSSRIYILLDSCLKRKNGHLSSRSLSKNLVAFSGAKRPGTHPWILDFGWPYLSPMQTVTDPVGDSHNTNLSPSFLFKEI